MARPIMNPNARFSDVKPIWDYATANNGIIWTTDNANNAIRLVMRLNVYRRTLRELAPDGYILEDLFIVSRNENVITVKRRPNPRGIMTTLDGKPPLSPDQAEGHLIQSVVTPDYDPPDLETA